MKRFFSLFAYNRSSLDVHICKWASPKSDVTHVKSGIWKLM